MAAPAVGTQRGAGTGSAPRGAGLTAPATNLPFADLLAHEGVEERCAIGSRFGFLAFHGGSLEEMTDVVAEAAAVRSGASYYGVVQPPDLRWHLPSTQVRPEASPTLAAFLDHVDVAVAVHGFGRDGLWTTLLLGGQNRRLAGHLRAHLSARLPEYTHLDDVERIPKALRGLHPENPVNRPRDAGVQLELPPRVRGRSPIWAHHEGAALTPHTEALIDALTDAARQWPPPDPASRGSRSGYGESRSSTHPAGPGVSTGEGRR